MDVIKKLNIDKQKQFGPFVNDKLLFPTILQDRYGKVLGLTYSTEESIKEAVTKKEGIYWSRSRDELWKKSDSDVNSQKLLNISLNCDGTALLFTVEQRGVFCHEKCLSCFDAAINKELKPITENGMISLGFCTGHQENMTFDLLKQLGIYVYHDKQSRNFDHIVKSHLHNEIKLIPIKPKDMSKFLDDAILDIAICYDNIVNDIETLTTYNKLCSTSTIHPVELVLLKKKGVEVKFNTIFTEYYELTKDYLMKNKLECDKLIPISGNAESYLINGLCDLCVTVRDTGKTINANNLEIVDIIHVSDLCVYIKKEICIKHPRLIRGIKNNLMGNTIFFYSVDDENGYLSNFYPVEFKDDKFTYKSSEHYYQSHKFTDDDIIHKIINSNTSKEALKIARDSKDFIVKDWDEMKDQVMYDAIYLKFSQNENLKKRLLDTKKKILVEHALSDPYWGCGSDGYGMNKLGILLMELRDRESIKN